MRAWLLALFVALPSALVLAPTASAADLGLLSEVRADEVVSAYFAGDDVRNASRVLFSPCVGSGGTVRFCYPPSNMTQGANGTWTGSQRLVGVQRAEALGLRATARFADGHNLSVPAAAGRYIWHAIAGESEAPRTPAPAGLAVAALLLLAGLAARRR